MRCCVASWGETTIINQLNIASQNWYWLIAILRWYTETVSGLGACACDMMVKGLCTVLKWQCEHMVLVKCSVIKICAMLDEKYKLLT